MVAHATVADLTAYLGTDPLPANAPVLLDRATVRVNMHLLATVYAVDASGVATDPKVRDALKRATCATVIYMAETGDTKGAGTAYTSVSIGSVQLQRKSGTATAGELPEIGADARAILSTEGLLPGTPYS
jgi:hypothetical protein